MIYLVNIDKEQQRSWLWLFAAFAVMFCIFAPLEIFLTNQTEFWFELLQILPVVLLSFTVVGMFFAICFFGLLKFMRGG